MFRFNHLFVVLMLIGLLVGETIALAQDTPVPTPTITPVPVEPPPVEVPADPPVEPAPYDFTSIDTWILMAVAVAGFVEVLKQSFLKPLRDALIRWFDEATTDQIYQSFIWLLSLGLAYMLIVNLADGKTLFDALKFPIHSLTLAQWLSAAAVVLGESFLHNVYDFVKLKAALPLLSVGELRLSTEPPDREYPGRS